MSNKNFEEKLKPSSRKILEAQKPDFAFGFYAGYSEAIEATNAAGLYGVLQEALPYIEQLIEATPSGEKRNQLCDYQIKLHEALAKAEQ